MSGSNQTNDLETNGLDDFEAGSVDARIASLNRRVAMLERKLDRAIVNPSRLGRAAGSLLLKTASWTLIAFVIILAIEALIGLIRVAVNKTP